MAPRILRILIVRGTCEFHAAKDNNFLFVRIFTDACDVAVDTTGGTLNRPGFVEGRDVWFSGGLS
ncbi:hypothetical protein, partial [Streptomyces noursei]|uniref:hypothetical protein n=1 Tax=Streptomyces noursei TaxID=1971 RepID=UPI001E5E159E